MVGSIETRGGNLYSNGSIHNGNVLEEKLDEFRRLLGKADGDPLRIVGVGAGAWGSVFAALLQDNYGQYREKVQIRIWRRPGRAVDRATAEHLFEVINSREDVLRRLIRRCAYLKYVEARLGDRTLYADEILKDGFCLNMIDTPLCPLKVVTNLQEAVWDADIVVNGLPSTETREVFEEISNYWKERITVPIIISLAKGIEAALDPVPHIITPTQMIKRAIGIPMENILYLGGPNIASEIYNMEYANARICGAEKWRKPLAKFLRQPHFTVWDNSDLVTHEVMGGLKNVYAIGAGMVAALTNESATSKSVYFAHCTSEMIFITHLLAEEPEKLAGPVIIGKGGETIKYLQLQSGAKIQVTRDMDADPNSQTRMVELMGTPEQIVKAEQLISEVLSEAEAGGSGIVSRRVTGQSGSDTFVMKVPNNKVGLVIGKGGETIKNMQARTGARIQVIPLHLPPGDTSIERTLQIDGTNEQIESAKQLVNEVISENRVRNPAMAGGYSQQGYQARPPTAWGAPGAPPMQQPGYGYAQPGTYPGPSPQYNMSQPSYPGYPQPTSGGYPSNWDQSTVAPSQQTSQGSGYDYYSQQPASQQQQTPGGPAAPADNTGYNYSQPPPSGYNQQGQGYSQDGYGAYQAQPQAGYGQPPPYDQQQGYTSASSYGNVTNAAQDGHTPSYASQGDSAQAPPVQASSVGQPGYTSAQQPSPSPASYPPQGTTQPGYGMPPTSQTGYGSQPPAQSGYGPGYGPPQAQKPLANPPAYGQATQSPGTPGGYGQPAPVQPGYPHSQPPPSSYAQPDSGPQRAPPSNYGAAAGQPGYGPPSYGAPPVGQPGYGQAPPPYNTYGSAYSQPPVYSADGSAAAAQTAQQSGVAKTSPQS